MEHHSEHVHTTGNYAQGKPFSPNKSKLAKIWELFLKMDI